MVRHVAEVFADGGASEVIVVVGCNADAVARAAGPPEIAPIAGTAAAAADARAFIPLRIAENAAWRLGMSSSAAAGARACSSDAEAIMICPADLPLLRPANVAALIRGFEALRCEHPGCAAAVAAHAGRRGHPAIVAAALRPALKQLGSAADDACAAAPLTLRDVIDLGMRGAPGGLALIEAGPECIARDVDRPADYEAVRPRNGIERRDPR